ncbi:N-acetylglucosamine-6-phosphate deacetylase [Alteromonas sp. CYL-A6]|uniref:N-acetylglucosamine-6-phosphate deacetylase n=1 Tax=Alteromonas nitratireducens TaxID=3390813 RepID=UPI0034C313E9
MTQTNTNTGTLTVARVLTPTGWKTSQTVTWCDGLIDGVRDATPDECRTMHAGMLVPGYIDTQVNGGGGVLLNQQPDVDGVRAIARAHAKFGTTRMLPTVITDTADVMHRAADAVADVVKEQNSTVAGIHFEGPFLSVDKKGVHSASFIRPPADRDVAVLMRKDIGRVLVTLAPEQTDPGFIRELVAEGVVVSLGHTNATYEQTCEALRAGATGFTHLYNAMSAMTSRAPGVVGAALDDAASYCGLIVDHHHVHPASARIAIHAKGISHMMLVTDAMAHVGSEITSMAFFDSTIERHGDKLTTPNGTLAGSCLDMHTAVLNTHHGLGIPLEDAITMASTVPATFMNMQRESGSIAVGARADLILLSPHNHQIEQVRVCGRTHGD